MDRFYWLAAIWLLYIAPFHTVDPEIVQYKKDFDLITSRYCKIPKFNKYAISIVPELKSGVMGVCYKGIINTSFIIDISEYYWNSLSDKQRRQLIFHELTHCYFNLDHSGKEYHYMYYEWVDVMNLDEQVENALIDICKLGKKTL